MESPAAVSRYIPQKSKKRVFPGGSSSSVCKEVDVLEICPPINHTSKLKSKQKEIAFHDIIDVDMEEDCDDVMIIDGKVNKSVKGKETLSSFSASLSKLSADGSGNDIQNGTTEDFSSNMFYEEDEWLDTYYDDIVFNDYEIMESQFDHMDIPSGVEAPFPWLPGSTNNNKVSATTSSTNPSSKLQSALNLDLYPDLKPSHSLHPLKIGLTKDVSTSWSNSNLNSQAASYHMKGKLPSKWDEPGLAQKKSSVEPLQSFGMTRRRSRASDMYSTSDNQSQSGVIYPKTFNNGTSYTTVHSFVYGVGSHSMLHHDYSMNMLDSVMSSPEYMDNSAFVSAKNPANYQNGACAMTPAQSMVEPKDISEIQQKFNAFKKFDTVEDYSDHHYSKTGSSGKQPPKNWAKRIQEEWKSLEKDLPDTIHVRVYESRMDLLRAVIVGAEGTPYHDGLYFFDVYFPSTYPNVPPHVHYHSGGLRINPNLYNCGKVCLSLLNTWSGSHKEKWIPGHSTMLQVLVSIQGLILNAKPYFNEPGYANMAGSARGEKSSLDYNERTFMYTLQTMVYNMRRPPKYFEDYVVGHFCKYAQDILVSCKEYLDGAQVGCLAKGGVQDVDEGDKSCSQQFKKKLAGFITTLVNTFSQIGAKDCQEFLSLAQKGN